MSDDLTPPHWGTDDIGSVLHRIESHNDVPVSVIVEAVTGLTAERAAAIARAEAAEAALKEAAWLLTDAMVQLCEGKIRTRRNRALMIRNFLDKHGEQP